MREIALDTNVFLLFLVGRANPGGIKRVKRLQAFAPEDYALLCQLIAPFDRMVVTPGCLAETTNLLDHDRLARETYFPELRALLHMPDTIREDYVPAARVTDERSFLWLGITDATYVDIARRGVPVITTDFKLYQQVISYCQQSVNFDFLRLN